ncbi:MAG: hypothetical protein RL093_1441 [Pseudomonadota bacterium]
MLFPVVMFASLALIQQAPATAPSQPPAENSVAAVPASSATRPAADIAQVCRTEPVTGSRFGRRVCRSAIQTEEDRAASREMLRQMQGARVPPSG